ncbi:hypothetical protein C482_10556 [Natrialba chahannaoensis JCM 10990]|uniref:DUF7988 domain-containing protein n=1 Tax=Natrialba chahannaoensis JCM 10990 TaxID=1227492 RepID=M0AKZ5_9EURY|nr:hypothetical protein [Natrialba chahannaoensis]ELY98991.1 hypothetical protein C482_10556 [Natrialba chahannaoensis JCM 10990]
MSYPVRAARRRIRADHTETITAIDDCAARVTRDWDTARTTNPETLVDSLQTELESTGVLETLPMVLSSAVDATGYGLQAQPVASPPYVVITSRGPVLRATIDPGRLVIRFDVFEVVRTDEPEQRAEYHRLDGVRLEIGLET